MSIIVLEHSSEVGSERLGETLRDFGHRLRVLRLHEGDPLPPDLDDVDGVICCGGEPSANDESLQWLQPELDYLRLAHEGDRPIVGLCLGSQVLARALGGTVGPVESGPEVGWHRVTLTPTGREDPLHAGIAWSMTLPQWHREEVDELPSGGRLLATGQASNVQAWAVGLRTYGFQYHPEIGDETLERWAATDPDALQETGLTIDQLRQQTAEHYPTFERLTRRLFEAIALLLMPIDRRYEGVVKDLHH